MARVGKIAISLPTELLSAVDESTENSGETRSEFFRHAAEDLLRSRKAKELAKRYTKAYSEDPESAKEIEAAAKSAAIILAAEPWE